jgi:hypothetical protein
MRVLITMLALTLGTLGQAPAEKSQLQQLRWLAGCWSGEMKSGIFEECWTIPRGDSIQVSARIVNKEGKTVFREFISVDETSDGVVMTIGHFGPGLKPENTPVPFRLVKLTESEAIFENPKHDHPQRVAYLRQPDGSVISRISLMDGTRAVDFPMRKPGMKSTP